MKKVNRGSPLHFSWLFKTVWWVQRGEWFEYGVSHRTQRQTIPGLGIWPVINVSLIYRKSMWRQDQYPDSTAFNIHLVKILTAPCFQDWHCFSVFWSTKELSLSVQGSYTVSWYLVVPSSDCLVSFIRKQTRNVFVNQWNEKHPNGYVLVTRSIEPAQMSPIDPACWSLENNLGDALRSVKGGVSF